MSKDVKQLTYDKNNKTKSKGNALAHKQTQIITLHCRLRP